MENKGVLVIINNMEFSHETGLGYRRGSDVDVMRLNHVFTELGFKIQVMQDLSASEMENVVWRSTLTFNILCIVARILTSLHHN